MHMIDRTFSTLTDGMVLMMPADFAGVVVLNERTLNVQLLRL